MYSQDVILLYTHGRAFKRLFSLPLQPLLLARPFPVATWFMNWNLNYFSSFTCVFIISFTHSPTIVVRPAQRVIRSVLRADFPGEFTKHPRTRFTAVNAIKTGTLNHLASLGVNDRRGMLLAHSPCGFPRRMGFSIIQQAVNTVASLHNNLHRHHVNDDTRVVRQYRVARPPNCFPLFIATSFNYQMVKSASM